MGRLRRLRPLRIAAAILFLFAAQFAAPAVHADDYSQNAVITTSDLDNQFGICNGSYGSPDAGMAGCASDYPWCNSVGTGGGNAPGDCHPTSGTIWWHYLSGWTAGTFANGNLNNNRQIWTSTVSFCGVSVGGGSCTPNETYNNSTYVYADCSAGQIGASFQDSFGDAAPYTCFVPYTGQNLSSAPCAANQDPITGQCYNNDRKMGKKCDCVGEPIDPSSGNMYETVTDFKGGGPFPLTFTRSYNSISANESDGTDSLGSGWTSNVFAHLSFLLPPGGYYTCTDDGSGYRGTGTDPNQGVEFICFAAMVTGTGSVTVWGADGSQQIFTATFSDGSPTTALTPVPGSSGSLTGSANTGWIYQGTDGYTEIFNAYGRLQSVTDPHGLTQNYTYSYTSDGHYLQSITVTDPAGRTMVVNYDPASHRVASLTVPAFNSTTASATIYYDVDTTSGNLQTVTYQDSSVVTYEYSDSSYPHALTGLKDETGNEYTAWGYDGSGNATCSEHAPSTASVCSRLDPAGVDITTVAYNTDGSADVTEATGLVRHMTFQNLDGSTQLASVDKRCIDCGDIDHTVTYDANGHLASVTDFDGNVTIYNIDASGFEQSRTEGAGTSYQRTIVTTWYTPTGGVEQGLPKSIKEEDASGTPLRVTTWCYNVSGSSCLDSMATGSLWSKTVTDPINTSLAARTSTYTYSSGFLTQVDGPLTGLSDTTTYTYYTAGSAGNYNVNDLQTITDALSHVTTVNQYSAAGRPLQITDMNGVVTAFTYDARGRLFKRILDSGGTDGNAATTTYNYNSNGTLLSVLLPITAMGHTYETYGYDRAQRRTSVSNDAGESKTYTYTYGTQCVAADTSCQTFDVEEQRYTSSNTLVYDHHLTRDDYLDQVRDTDGNGNTTAYQRDLNGNVFTVTDPLSHVTTNYYDALNRVDETVDATNEPTGYTLDALDHTTKITSPRNLNTTYVYDAYGDLLSQVSPDTGTTTNNYANWLSQAKIVSTDAAGKVQTYSYDALYRLLSQINGQSNITYAYDDTASGDFGIGRLHTITDFSGSSTYLYNSHGKVRSKALSMTAASQSYSMNYSYDLADDLTLLGGTGHGTITYINDSLGRPTEVDAGAALASSVTYMPFGPLSGLTYGNGLVETRSFDHAYRLTGIVTKNGSTPSVQDWAYSYNSDGTISQIQDLLNGSNTQNFTAYDPMQRLVTASGSYGSITLVDPSGHNPPYDADGNRNQITSNGVMTTYTYDYTGSSHAAPNDILNTAKTGSNTVSYGYDPDGSTSSDGTYTYSYSINERVGKVLKGSASVYYIYYNGLGQRVSNTVTGGTYSYAYDEAGHFVAELNPNNTIYSQVVWLGDRPIAYYNRDIRGSTSADVDYLHVDALNTPRVMTTSTKSIGWSWNPDPWGNGGGATGNLRLHFPGQFYDTGDGKDQNWMRDYDPQTGRYLESDPIGLNGGINTYSYALDNPESYFDPSGLQTMVIVSGPTASNPFGHSALAFTNEGTFSYGTKDPYGSNTSAYLASQLESRDVTVYVLNTTPAQEQEMINFIQLNYGPGHYSAYSHNCATMVNDALAAVGIGSKYDDVPNNLPSSAGINASTFPGVTTVNLSQGASVPSAFGSFNP